MANRIYIFYATIALCISCSQSCTTIPQICAPLESGCTSRRTSLFRYSGHEDRRGLKSQGFLSDPDSGNENEGIKREVDYNSVDEMAINEKEKLEENNKAIVVAFYQAFFGDKDFSAIDKYISQSKYIQHNPEVLDGAAAFREFFSFYHGAPKSVIDFQRVGADGDIVYVHVRDTSIEPGTVYAVMDIFRVEDGLITEHWDVLQPVPKQSVNPHPMF